MVSIWKRFSLAAVVAVVAFGASHESKADSVVLSANSITASDHPGKMAIIRDGLASTAPTPKLFPGQTDMSPNQIYSLTFDLFNLQPGTTVSLTTTMSTSNLVLSMYDASFDPNNLATNYLGDAGISTTLPLTFSVTAPASGHVVVVASTVTTNNTSDFAFSAEVTYTPNAVVPEPASLAMLLTSGAVLAAASARRRLAS